MPRTFPLLLLCAPLFLSACDPSRSFEVRGRVAGFSDDGRTVFVEHEAIPGYMPAMTMPFDVQDPAVLAGLANRDALRFTLVVTREASWIEDVEKLPFDALPAHPAAAEDPFRPTDAPPLLQEGDPAPPFILIDQAGDTLRFGDYGGQALLLTFIYTRCPLPDFCPLISRHFQQLQPPLQEKYGDRVQLLSISFDPANDTPAVLNEYAARYTDDVSTWRFATGPEEEIAGLAGRYGVFYKADDGQEFLHNLTTALIDPDGRVRRLWRGTGWTPDAVLAAVEELHL